MRTYLLFFSVIIAWNASAQTVRAPVFSVSPFDQAVLVSWDSISEKSPNVFNGYRLYRGRLAGGPFTMIREWRVSSTTPAVRLFLDIGDDDGDGVLSQTEGLHNMLTYYYRLTAFADSVVNPYRPFMESGSEVLFATPSTVATNYALMPVTLVQQTGLAGDIQTPRLTITSTGNFRRFFEGHTLTVSVSTANAGSAYIFPVVVKDQQTGFTGSYFLNPGLLVTGDSSNAGLKQGTFTGANVFSLNSFDVLADWKFTQRAAALHLDTVVQAAGDPQPNTPIFFRDTVASKFVGLKSSLNTLGESTYEIEFLPGGVDTVNASLKQIFNYLNLKMTETNNSRALQPVTNVVTHFATVTNQWSASRYAFNTQAPSPFAQIGFEANRYYYRTVVDSSTIWEFANVFSIEDTRVVLDYSGVGRGPGRNWPTSSYKPTQDFKAGDKVRVVLAGGVRGSMPYQALYTYQVGSAPLIRATENLLDQIRVVPNPYLIRHEAQRSVGEPSLRFDYLPEECEIRIYTVGLELVKILRHRGGAVELWDMKNGASNRVGSQMFIARISEPGGASVIKKFSVVLGE